MTPIIQNLIFLLIVTRDDLYESKIEKKLIHFLCFKRSQENQINSKYQLLQNISSMQQHQRKMRNISINRANIPLLQVPFFNTLDMNALEKKN